MALFRCACTMRNEMRSFLSQSRSSARTGVSGIQHQAKPIDCNNLVRTDVLDRRLAEARTERDSPNGRLRAFGSLRFTSVPYQIDLRHRARGSSGRARWRPAAPYACRPGIGCGRAHPPKRASSANMTRELKPPLAAACRAVLTAVGIRV
jgi:hypothetical protein